MTNQEISNKMLDFNYKIANKLYSAASRVEQRHKKDAVKNLREAHGMLYDLLFEFEDMTDLGVL